jgi:hypothetical protein
MKKLLGISLILLPIIIASTAIVLIAGIKAMFLCICTLFLFFSLSFLMMLGAAMLFDV